MTRQDDELVRRYHEASEQEGARPGAHVRDAVRAHAQMLAAATAQQATESSPVPAAILTPPSRTAANQLRWKASALATVAVIGLAGLVMLQFERGTPEEKEIAYGQRRADMAAPAAVPPPAPATEQGSEPPAPATVPDDARAPSRPSAPATAPRPAAPEPQPAVPQAKTAPDIREAEAPTAPGQAGGVSAFPASPPAVAALHIPPRPAPAPAPLAESHKRSAAQDASVGRQALPANEAAAPTAGRAAAESTRAVAPAQSMPSPAANSAPRVPRLHDLHNAARAGDIPKVESLIRQGAVVDARDSAGRTALMLAAMQGQTATVQKLLALGANPALLDREGLSAAQLARRQGHTSLADLMKVERR